MNVAAQIASIKIQADAVMVTVESMKAQNECWKLSGITHGHPPFPPKDFVEASLTLYALSEDLQTIAQEN